MNKEERVKVFFEAISKIAGFEIKPDKEFYMIVEDDMNMYKISENINLYCETITGDYKMSAYNISVLFNDKCQFEKISEPLLTKEEKEFLRQFKFESLEVRAHFSDIGTIVALRFTTQGGFCYTIPINMINYEFKGLEANKKYSGKELGL